MTKYLLGTILACLCSILSLNAQSNSNTYSPYSSMGLGEIASDYSRTAGMGSVAIGMNSGTFLNTTNPAGVAALDSLTGVFDVGLYARYSYYKGRSYSNSTFTGNFSKIALGFRCNKLWSISVGIKPYSNIGYHISDEVSVEGSTSTKTVYFEGEGGLYNLYMINAVKLLNDKLYLGAISSLIAGNFTKTEDQIVYRYKTTSRTTQFYTKFGAQYQFYNGLGNWTIGATYGYKYKFRVKNTDQIYSGNTPGEIEDLRSTNQFFPESYGLGVSLKKDKFVFAADGEWERWSGLVSGLSTVKIGDSYKVKAGVGYTPYKDMYTAYLTKQYQAGLILNKSYIEVNGGAAWNCALTAGVSIPIRSGGAQKGVLGFGLEVGTTPIAPAGYSKENYALLNINFSFIEAMFMRRKIF